MSQVPEEAFTLAQYRNTFRERYKFTNVTVLGSDANGTHFFYDDALGERHFGVISDLVGFKIVQAGQESITIAAGATLQSDTVNITPLPDATAANWNVFATIQRTVAGILQHSIVYADLLDSDGDSRFDQMRLVMRRIGQLQTTTQPATTSTVSPEPDTGHAHDWPTANIAIGGLGGGTLGALTMIVFWMIV